MPRIVNGLDVDALMATVESITKQPELAKAKFRIANRWVNGTNNQALIQGFYGALEEHPERSCQQTFEIDEPALLLGHDKGPNPVEYVLIALSGWLTTSLVAWAAASGVELKSVESRLEGDLDLRGFLAIDPGVRNGYQELRFTFAIVSDADDETLRKLVQTAADRSPVYDVVSNKTPVKVEFSRA